MVQNFLGFLLPSDKYENGNPEPKHLPEDVS